MTQFKRNEYHIAAHFLPALINGDYTSLSPDESASLDVWRAQAELPGGHWGSYENSGFRRCEITGLMAECAEVVYLTLIED